MSEVKKLAQQLKNNGEKLDQFLASLEDQDWGKQVYADGEQWRIKQLITHIVETEREIPELIMLVLTGHGGVPEGFDIDDHNKDQVNNVVDLDIDKLKNLFSERRLKTISLVEKMTPEDLMRRGRHPFLGETEVYEMFRLMSLHIQLHIRDMRKAL